MLSSFEEWKIPGSQSTVIVKVLDPSKADLSTQLVLPLIEDMEKETD